MVQVESGIGILVDSARAVFSGLVSRIIIAAIILFIGFIAGRVFGRLLEKILKELELNDILTRLTGLNAPFAQFAGGIATYFAYFITVVMALDKLGIGAFVFNLIASAVILVIILSILLTLKDVVPNFVAGFFIRQKRMVRPGDRIRLGNVEGKVISVDSVETIVETKRKDIFYIPNAALVNEEVVKLRR